MSKKAVFNTTSEIAYHHLTVSQKQGARPITYTVCKISFISIKPNWVAYFWLRCHYRNTTTIQASFYKSTKLQTVLPFIRVYFRNITLYQGTKTVRPTYTILSGVIKLLWCFVLASISGKLAALKCSSSYRWVLIAYSTYTVQRLISKHTNNSHFVSRIDAKTIRWCTL